MRTPRLETGAGERCITQAPILVDRDVSGVELLMNNHQSLKAEIDTREDNFSACISLGKELLSRQHYASGDIKEKLLQLTNQRNALLRRWEERWENLQLSQCRPWFASVVSVAPEAHLDFPPQSWRCTSSRATRRWRRRG